jgi:hypothetical protein
VSFVMMLGAKNDEVFFYVIGGIPIDVVNLAA